MDITPAILLQHLQGMEARLREDLASKKDLKSMAGKEDLKSMEKRLNDRIIATETRITKRLDGLENYANSILAIVENIQNKLTALEKRVDRIEQEDLPKINKALQLIS